MHCGRERSKQFVIVIVPDEVDVRPHCTKQLSLHSLLNILHHIIIKATQDNF